MRPLAKTLLWTLVALAGGFIGGIVLSEWIGIVGYLVFQRAVGIKFLPVYTALVAAFVVLVLNLRNRNRQPS